MAEPRRFLQKVLSLAQHGSLRSLGTQLMSAAAMMLFAAVILFGLNIVGLRTLIGEDRKADRTIEQLYQVENHLLNIELSIRGYALTSDAQFERYFRYEHQMLDAALEPLIPLTAGMADHELHLGRVKDAVRARVDALAQMMQMAQGDAAKVSAAIRDPKVRDTMRDARAQIAAMRQMELGHREQLASESRSEADRNSLLGGGILIMSILIGALGLFFAFFGGPEPSQASARPGIS